MKTPSESRHNAQNSENEHVWHYYALWHGNNGQLYAEKESRKAAQKIKTRKYVYYGNADVIVLYHSDASPCRCALSEAEADFFANALLNGHTRTIHVDLVAMTEVITDDLPMNWE